MGVSFGEAWVSSREINGWLTEEQGAALYEAAAEVPAGQWIVEIGSHHGKSTNLLARARHPGVNVLAVDPFDDPRWGGGSDALEEFRANTAGLQVELARGYGSDVGKEWGGAPVGLLFVDGAHDYPAVSADVAAWVPHLADGARVFFHDAFSSPGVTRAVFHAGWLSGRLRYAGSARSLARFEYGPVGLGARLMAAARMLGRLRWFARNVAVKVALRKGWARAHRALGHESPTVYPY